MDRQIVYPAQIPLDSDQLNAQRNAYVGLGQLAAMAYGWATVAASGFACTPGSGLALVIAPGSLLAPGVVDASAYGTLAAVASQLVRQYASRDPVTLTVPGAGATYSVYVTPATVDTDDTVLPFYNAADPAVTYAGADNSGRTAPTVRQDVAQLSIGTTVPAGAYALWTVTVPAGATAITADMIAQADGAPFYETIPQLQASDAAETARAEAAEAGKVSGTFGMSGEDAQVQSLLWGQATDGSWRPLIGYGDVIAETQWDAVALYSDIVTVTASINTVQSNLTAAVTSLSDTISTETSRAETAEATKVSGTFGMTGTNAQVQSLLWGQATDGSWRPLIGYGDVITNTQWNSLAVYSDITTLRTAHGVVTLTPGTTSWTVPANVYSIDVEARGGGGGGGGATGKGAGAGGGGGGYCRGRFSVTPGQEISLSVGAGGTASSGGDGTLGGATTILGMTAGGGGAGGAGANAIDSVYGGAGGSAAGGAVNQPGCAGQGATGNSSLYVSGMGGACFGGAGTMFVSQNTGGYSGAFPGCGGGGGSSLSGSYPGGSGSDGHIIIHW
ncbi:hypothetical protein [Komagataeibacter sp. FXV3]|uniref:glycine-rich domain-containing protein n=1 Tax=Komagataeibacter sp. FXV3 TaxID=2608998 RepID=UPI00187B6496|nr:hypothetical protein [Komagataeibacter sp. FXV3]MBE7728859.1 hypothetical protein [Komagataeibacter sp. FXV3]